MPTVCLQMAKIRWHRSVTSILTTQHTMILLAESIVKYFTNVATRLPIFSFVVGRLCITYLRWIEGASVDLYSGGSRCRLRRWRARPCLKTCTVWGIDWVAALIIWRNNYIYCIIIHDKLNLNDVTFYNIYIQLTLSSLNLPLSSSSTTICELLSQFSTCGRWRWFEVGGKWKTMLLLLK